MVLYAVLKVKEVVWSS